MLERLWVVAVAVLMLQGCAATGPKGSEMVADLAAVPAGYGRIVFYRPNSIVGAAVQPEIRLDGQVVGQSKPGGFFYVDAAPGLHMLQASTEVGSKIDVQVMAGQTHYVRSTIGAGLFVGRVLLSVEGMIVARGEVSSLSYTGATAPRVGAPPGAGRPAPLPAAATAIAPLKVGDRLVYRVTDLYTGQSRDVMLTVDGIGDGRIVFNQGARVEGLDGTVISLSTALAGDMDGCAPPGGWARPDMLLGMRWSVQYQKRGSVGCTGSFDMQGQMVSDELSKTAVGDLQLQRIDYAGGTLRGTVMIPIVARVWYAPALKRVVRFESERSGRVDANSREKVELVAIGRN